MTKTDYKTGLRFKFWDFFDFFIFWSLTYNTFIIKMNGSCQKLNILFSNGPRTKTKTVLEMACKKDQESKGFKCVMWGLGHSVSAYCTPSPSHPCPPVEGHTGAMAVAAMVLMLWLYSAYRWNRKGHKKERKKEREKIALWNYLKLETKHFLKVFLNTN